MNHLLKLTTAALVVLTPTIASAEWTQTGTYPFHTVIQVMEPPVLIEIEIPGPPQIYSTLVTGAATAVPEGQLIQQGLAVGR